VEHFNDNNMDIIIIKSKCFLVRMISMKRSAGILPYKIIDNKIYVYLEHPGGPFWKGKDSYSICKGEYKQEKAMDAAIREFKEETSFDVDKDKLFYVGTIKQKSGKLVTMFGIEMDIDPEKMHSNTFKKEWPPRSGKFEEFPEMDEGKWFTIEEAYTKIFSSQKKFLIKLENIINS